MPHASCVPTQQLLFLCRRKRRRGLQKQTATRSFTSLPAGRLQDAYTPCGYRRQRGKGKYIGGLRQDMYDTQVGIDMENRQVGQSLSNLSNTKSNIDAMSKAFSP